MIARELDALALALASVAKVQRLAASVLRRGTDLDPDGVDAPLMRDVTAALLDLEASAGGARDILGVPGGVWESVRKKKQEALEKLRSDLVGRLADQCDDCEGKGWDVYNEEDDYAGEIQACDCGLIQTDAEASLHAVGHGFVCKEDEDEPGHYVITHRYTPPSIAALRVISAMSELSDDQKSLLQGPEPFLLGWVSRLADGESPEALRDLMRERLERLRLGNVILELGGEP